MAINLESQIPLPWREYLDYPLLLSQIGEFLDNELTNGRLFQPSLERIFYALKLTDPNKVRVALFGQDPYPTPGVPMGLAFSVAQGKPLPQSLKNIFKEMESDIGSTPPTTGDLSPWAREGMLLLNSTLTCQVGIANSHKNCGWNTLTNHLIENLSQARGDGIVFLLWGGYAQDKAKHIIGPNHKLISSVHPSPLSAYRGFFGSRPFSKINKALLDLGKEEFNFRLD